MLRKDALCVGKHKKNNKNGRKNTVQKVGLQLLRPAEQPIQRLQRTSGCNRSTAATRQPCVIETRVSDNLLPVAESPASLQTCVLIVRSVVEWKQRAGLRCTTCPKCSCEGDALGCSHSLLRDCSCTLKSPFCIMVKEAPALKLAALQQVRSRLAEVETLKDAWRGGGRA